jgi:hypothetical protein
METDQSIMKNQLEALDVSALVCLAKALEYFFEDGFMTFLPGTSQDGYIKYVISEVLSTSKGKTRGSDILKVFNSAIKMAQDQALFIRTQYH